MRNITKILFLLAAMVFLAGCANSPTGPNSGKWVKVCDAPWEARHFLSGTVFANSMWVIGGLSCTPDAAVTTYYGDVWTSSNGANWSQTLSTGNSPFGSRYGHRVLSLNGKMFLIGGKSAGNLKNDVWSSTDGVTWTNILPNAITPGPGQFTHRMDFGAQVFNNLLWIIGGFDGNDRNDVWNSPDGITWTQVLANGTSTPTHFHGRWGHSTAVFNNLLWVVGGASGINSTLPPTQGYSDVWTSPDGVTWTKVYAGTSYSPIYYHQTVVNNNLIWLTCGWGWPYWGPRSLFGTSPDGINWSYSNPSILPRFYHLSLSFDGSAWVMGGLGQDSPDGTKNFYSDVWRSQ